MGIAARQRPVEPCQDRISHECLYEIAGVWPTFRTHRGPVSCGEQNWNPANGESVNERLASLQCLLKLKKREAGIDGDKGAIRIGGQQSRGVLPAFLPYAIAQNVQKLLRILTIGHAKHAVCASNSVELSSLLEVTIQQG